MGLGLMELAGALLDALSAFDPAVLSGHDAAAVAEQLARTEKACAAGRARAAVRAAECGGHGGRGFSEAADWLARVAGSTRREAQAALAVGSVGGATGAALVAGELSLGQAAVIVEAAAECPGSEADMLELAGRSSLATLRDEG